MQKEQQEQDEQWIVVLANVERHSQTEITKAWTGLYEGVGRKVRARLRLAGADEASAEDALTEALIDVYSKKARLDEQRGNARSLLTVVALHKMQDRWRKEKLHEAPLDNVESLADVCGVWANEAHGESPENILERKQREHALATCLDSLQPEKRQTVAWWLTGRGAIKQLAEEFGVPEGTIKSRLDAAKAFLYRCLEGKGFTENSKQERNDD